LPPFSLLDQMFRPPLPRIEQMKNPAKNRAKINALFMVSHGLNREAGDKGAHWSMGTKTGNPHEMKGEWEVWSHSGALLAIPGIKNGAKRNASNRFSGDELTRANDDSTIGR
jgi:hypothetical protein